jgi:hypothetical protein
VSRRLALLLAAAGLVLGATAPALASIPGPGLPNPADCHSMNEFLHIDNVRDCNNNG